MGLRIWLPLNNTLENKGVSDYPITKASAVTFNASGKIGYCATAASSANITITVPDITTIVGEGTQYSLACWVKVQGRSANGWAVKFGNNSCGLWWGYSAARWVWNENDNGKRISSEIASDTTNWHHIAVTVDKTTSGQITTKQYVDGVPAPGYPGSTFSTPATLPTGTTITINPYVASLNDVRIYDHCLSAAEVREISQGLVLHYKLDNLQGETITNLLSEAQSYPEPNEMPVVNSNNTNSYINSAVICSNTGNNIVTYSAYIINNMDTTIYPRLRGMGADGSTYGSYVSGNTLAAGQSGWVTVTLDMRDTTQYDGTSVYLRWQLGKARNTITNNPIRQYAQLEVCDHRSDWVLGGTTVTGTIQDSSGYNNVATLLGKPTLIYRSPRYSKGVQFNGIYDAINCGLDWQIQGSPEITVSCWIYDENWSNSTGKYYFSSQQTGGFLISQKADNKFRFRMDTYTDSALSARAYKDIDVTATVEAGWHHFVGVYTTSALKIYIDGELKGTNNVTTYGAHFGTATSLFLGAECAGKVTATPFCACSLSDFRFYYTALLEDDIKQLYQLGAKIDNQQNLHTFELNEIPISVIGTGLSTSYSESHPITTIHTYRTATNTQNQYTQQSITCTGNIYTSAQIPVNLGRTYYFRFNNQNSITSKQYSYTPYTWVRSGRGYVRRPQSTVYGRYAKFILSVLFYDSDSRLLGTKILNSGTINDQGSSSYSPITMSMGIMSDNSEFTIPYVLINNSEETAYIVIKEEYYASSASVNNRILVAEYSPTVGIKIQKPGIVRTNYIKEITDTKFRKDKIIETNNLIEI